ncbi:MAG: uracil-DNA glycosylase [Crocinitomicaceae bacterium]|jgi:uracil-DNA glycosylase
MNLDLHSSWKEILNDELQKPYYVELTDEVKRLYIDKKGSIFPEVTDIFRAFDLCPLDAVKVVILGQDPYPTKGHAHGLCFSVEPDVRPFPKSLNNIFKEIQDDLGKPIPSDGNLERWAKQGVLLLNSVLTVEEGKPDSHKGLGWEKFTDAVIRKINVQKEGIVIMLWGSKAIAKEEMIDKSKHLILKSVHPSPLSAYRGFFGCKHFSKSNEFLRMMEKPEIDW